MVLTSFCSRFTLQNMLGTMNESADSHAEKQAYFRALLMQDGVVVHADARKSGVVVPTQFRHVSTLILVFGYTLNVPTNDVQTTAAGITATLSFNRQPFQVTLPWESVYIIVDRNGTGLIWQDDVPADSVEATEDILTPPMPPPVTKRRFTLLDGGKNK